MIILTKEKLYEQVVNAIGEVLQIPPIEYCFMQCGEHYQLLGFNCGNALIIYTRAHRKHSVTIVDEWSHRTFTDAKELVNFLE